MQKSESVKPPLTGIFFTKSGAIITRPMKHAVSSLVIPMNTQDPRLFLKDGEIVQPFVKITFKHIRNVSLASRMLAIYEESESAEFNPEGMTPVPFRSLDTDFTELNAGIDV